MIAHRPEQLESILHLTYETMQIPFCHVHPTGEVGFTVPYRPFGSFAYPEPSSLLERLQLDEVPFACPVIRVLANTESYILIKLGRESEALGTIVAGPILQHPVSGATIDHFLTEHRIPRKYKNEALQYYGRKPVLTYRKIQSMALLLHYLAYGEKIDIEMLAEGNDGRALLAETDLEQFVESSLSDNRQNEFYHHSYAAQSAIFDCVRDGDASRLRKTLNASMDGERGILCRNNPLRNQKNFAICGTALATRSAIEGGLDSEIAFTLSDRYIQHFEDLSDMNEVANMHHKMLYDFTKLVHEVQNSKYSYIVTRCKAYIAARLLQEIDYEVLARLTNLNKHYLAELFKRETGLTIGEYIQKERIAEAKRMMSNSEVSLLDIAIALRFYDQSHFTRTFKKWCGYTPKQYRTRLSLVRSSG